MKFDTLRSEYIPQIAAIERDSFERPWSEQAFLPELADENAHYVVGVQDGQVICYAGFHSVADEAHMTNVAVRRDMRGRGVGKLLMCELLDCARRLGLKHVTLEVRDGNEAAVRLYAGCGFKVEGVRRKYYNNMHDALIMWLHFGEDIG